MKRYLLAGLCGAALAAAAFLCVLFLGNFQVTHDETTGNQPPRSAESHGSGVYGGSSNVYGGNSDVYRSNSSIYGE